MVNGEMVILQVGSVKGLRPMECDYWVLVLYMATQDSTLLIMYWVDSDTSYVTVCELPILGVKIYDWIRSKFYPKGK